MSLQAQPLKKKVCKRNIALAYNEWVHPLGVSVEIELKINWQGWNKN